MQKIKTQVRFSQTVHTELNEYATKYGMSMNSAINQLVVKGLHDDKTANIPHMKEQYLNLLEHLTEDLNASDLKQLCDIAERLNIINEIS